MKARRHSHSKKHNSQSLWKLKKCEKKKRGKIVGFFVDGPKKVRSSETSDEGVDGLIGQEMTFDTDLFIERTPQFRLKEKDVTMSPDFGRSAKVGEGQLVLNTTHAQFPSIVWWS